MNLSVVRFAFSFAPIALTMCVPAATTPGGTQAPGAPATTPQTAAAPAATAAPAAPPTQCSPSWPTHCPHSLPVQGDCFAAGVSCGTLRHCAPETFARACPAGQTVECWSAPQGGNYGRCK